MPGSLHRSLIDAGTSGNSPTDGPTLHIPLEEDHIPTKAHPDNEVVEHVSLL